jgi:hypothetical protein
VRQADTRWENIKIAIDQIDTNAVRRANFLIRSLLQPRAKGGSHAHSQSNKEICCHSHSKSRPASQDGARGRITSRRGWRRDGPTHETQVTLELCICTNGLRLARPQRQPGAKGRSRSVRCWHRRGRRARLATRALWGSLHYWRSLFRPPFSLLPLAD